MFLFFFRKCWTFSGSFFVLFYFSVPYFGLACDHGNSFLCLEEYQVRKRRVLDRGQNGF